MDRRKFLSRAAVAGGAVSAAAASQAIAQAPALPNIKWRLASSFPKSLDTIYGGAETLSKRIAAITGGKFQVQVFAGGEIVPPFSVTDAVQNGTVECGHTASYYFVGKNKAFGFDTTLPFGMNQRQQNAWMYYGGGLQLVREFMKDYNIITFPGGNSGTQMGGQSLYDQINNFEPLAPEEIASVAVYMASRDSGGMTGQSVLLDGGLLFV